MRGFVGLEGRKRFEGKAERIRPIVTAYVAILQAGKDKSVGYDELVV